MRTKLVLAAALMALGGPAFAAPPHHAAVSAAPSAHAPRGSVHAQDARALQPRAYAPAVTYRGGPKSPI